MLDRKHEMLDLIQVEALENHKVFFFSTLPRLVDVMEDYLEWKGYRYLRLDGSTGGSERGALMQELNAPQSEAFIFLLSIRGGGIGINLQADDTHWDPQVKSIEEHVRPSAEFKLGVANRSTTAGFISVGNRICSHVI